MRSYGKSQSLSRATQEIICTIKQRLKDRRNPFIVSIDGGSGAGKSSIAAEVESVFRATVISCDDFYNINIPEKEWDTYTIEKRCRLCIDWERLRKEALLPLLSGKKALYYPYYITMTNNLSDKTVVKEPSQLIILDGIYSSYWLADLINFSVLVDVPPEARYRRHNKREGTEDKEWHLRWDPVEDYYLQNLKLPKTYNLIVKNE